MSHRVRSALAVSIFADHPFPRRVHTYEDHREEQDHRGRDDQDVEGTVKQVTNHHATMLAYSTVLAPAAERFMTFCEDVAGGMGGTRAVG